MEDKIRFKLRELVLKAQTSQADIVEKQKRVDQAQAEVNCMTEMLKGILGARDVLSLLFLQGSGGLNLEQAWNQNWGSLQKDVLGEDGGDDCEGLE